MFDKLMNELMMDDKWMMKMKEPDETDVEEADDSLMAEDESSRMSAMSSSSTGSARKKKKEEKGARSEKSLNSSK